MTGTPDLETALDAMHAALLAADFPRLHQLSLDVETALAAGGAAGDPGTVARLRRKAERNARCAQAAGRGVRAALRRIADIRQSASGLVTYDRAGRRSEAGGIERLTRRY